MSTENTQAANTPLWRDYLELTKPRVVGLIVFTAVIGMFMARRELVDMSVLIFGTLGIWMAASGAAVINQLLDREADAQMTRTKHRPLIHGRVTVQQAYVFAALLALTSMVMLVVFTNVLTAVLTFVSLVGYAYIYTLFLKRATPQNIVIGGASGAAPPLLGWTAVTGAIEPGGLILFLIIFVWTPPHFWALAIYRKDEYALVNIPMLPVTHGVEYTRLQILLYTILLALVTLLPFMIQMSSYIYLVGVIILNAIFLYYAVALRTSEDPELPMRMFWFSIIYLMALFFFLLLDHYVSPLIG